MQRGDRSLSSRVVRSLLLLLSSLIAAQLCGNDTTPSGPADLKLVISVEQQIITAPFPARVTLHLHNSGKETLWLYRHVSAANSAPSPSESATVSAAQPHSIEGPTLAVRLESEDQRAVSSGAVLESVGLPHPKLIRLAPDDDYEEKAVVRLIPAMAAGAGEKKPVWGRYKLTVSYAATYSNAAELERSAGVQLWQGEIQANTIEIELQPPPATAQGSIAGTVTGPDNMPRNNVLVSLSDAQERLVDQTSTNFDGKYSFANLPPALYWVTVRRRDSDENTVIFRHAELTPSEPAGAIDFLLTPPETYEPKQMLHKPVLIRVTDSAGESLRNATLEITWSSGTVLDNVKAQTSDDGTAAVELIPGRNYVTLKRKGCPKQEERLDVAQGPGIDGFKLVSECSKK